jgi:histidyl-tRNA synthetase
VFEIWSSDSDSEARQSSLGGGGRYDDLVKTIGGEDIPAVGFAFGVERVIKKLLDDKVNLNKKITKQVFLVQLGDAARKKTLKLFDKLIDNKISVGESLGRGSIKSQLKIANKFDTKLSLIIGQKEALDDTIIIRDMESGIQEIVTAEKIIAEIKRRLKK